MVERVVASIVHGVDGEWSMSRTNDRQCEVEVIFSPRFFERRCCRDSSVTFDRAQQFDLLAPRVRAAIARIYEQIWRAECFGADLVSKLVAAAPEGPLRDFARLQLADERRHVAFFSEVVAALGSDLEEPSSLSVLREGMADVDGYAQVLVHVQVMENAASALFGGIVRQSLRMIAQRIRLPGVSAVEQLLRDVSCIVGRDEALHVAFGMKVLRGFCHGRRAEARALEQHVVHACTLMRGVFSELSGSYQHLGFVEGEVMHSIDVAQRRFWGHLDIATDAIGSEARL